MLKSNRNEPNFKDVAKKLGINIKALGKTKIPMPRVRRGKRSLAGYLALGAVIVLLILSTIFFIFAYIPARLIQLCSKGIWVLSRKYGGRPL